MRYSWLDDYLMDKPAVTKDFKIEWNWIRYFIGGKMFAAVLLDKESKPYYINLKLEPLEGDFWRTQYEDIVPGYYSNKQHWNSIKPDDVFEVEIELDELDLTSAESKATYKEIQEYVLKAQEVRWTSVLRGPKRSEDRR